MNIAFYIKQIAKMFMQQTYMPALYRIYSRRPMEKGLVLFADGHTKNGVIPFSMQKMYEAVKEKSDYHAERHITDFGNMGYISMLRWIRRFMKRYAVSEFVFICDNFLPVSSCKKRRETMVIQLWHSGGILKKSGYDTTDDIPKMYRGNVYRNYDLVTVSAPAVVPVFQSFMRQPEGIIQATGTSRSDWYFDAAWNAENRRYFYERYPEAQGKQVIMWAPTFRGNAGTPTLYGMDSIREVMKETKDKYFWLIKLHPHLEGKDMKSNCDIPSERLLAVADLMITDYSSILFDYLAYQKPFVLFAPDLEEYERTRGFYLPYDSYPTTVVTEGSGLKAAIERELHERSQSELKEAYMYHMGSCDGHATSRIIAMTLSKK